MSPITKTRLLLATPIAALVLTAGTCCASKVSAFQADYSAHKTANAIDITQLQTRRSDDAARLERIEAKLDRLLERLMRE